MPKKLRPAPAPLPGWTREGLIWKSTNETRPADEPLRTSTTNPTHIGAQRGTCHQCGHPAYSNSALYCTTCVHGTVAGERWHRATGTPVCEPCRIYKNQRQTELRAAKARNGVDHALLEAPTVQLTQANSNPEERREIVRRFHALGLSDSQIADRTGLTPRTALRIRHRLGLPPNYNHVQNRRESA